MQPIPRTLFVGTGRSAVCWYRIALPAMQLGADWCGVQGAPPELAFVTGGRRPVTSVEAFADYDVVVLQQPRGAAWVTLIRRLQAGGTAVLFEIDDDIASVRKAADHDNRSRIDRDWVRATELAMRACDGVICSTDFLARRYGALNGRTFVCRNGLDLKRYDLTRGAGAQVTLGWAGATGHQRAFDSWQPALRELMRDRPQTRFMSIGQRFADALAPEFGESRCVSIPFGPLETYPAAIANLDIALAPAGNSNFFRAKSDLRWLEAAALGIPAIADPVVYPGIEHGVTGFHAANPAAAGELMRTLVDDRALRERVGAAARETVRATRSIAVAAGQWRATLCEAAALATAATA
jgi:glycosyltransferase involved in cell wall biosynthesis